MTDDQIREMLREMGREPVPPDSLVRMRQRLDTRIHARLEGRAPFAWWFGALATAALLVIAILFTPWSSRKRVELPPLRARLAQPPPLERTPAPVLRVARRTPVVKSPVTRASEAIDIRIETDDPDVVILLTGE